MPFPRKRSPLQFSEQDLLRLESIRKSRTEEKRRTLRAAFLLDSRSGQTDVAIARHHHVSRSTVVLCIQKFLQFGLGLSAGLCLPEAEGSGLFLRIVDVQAVAQNDW